MVWWLEVLAQFATSTGLAVVCILVFWTYGLAFGRLYMKLLAGQRAADGRCIPAWGEFCYRPGRNSRQQSLIVVVPG